MAKAKPPTAKETELKRWCIEMAMRWPVVHVPATLSNQMGAAGNLYQQQAQPAREVDADVIGRASKIRDWVRSA